MLSKTDILQKRIGGTASLYLYYHALLLITKKHRDI